MKRPIAISLSPNTEKDDVLLALKLLVSPIQWFNFRHTEMLEKEFAKMFTEKYKAIAVNSGRSALYLALKALGVGEDDDIILQALTCVAVPNSIIWLKAKPVFVDVDNSFNLDVKDLSKKITKKTKAIIVQHSFGIPADMEKIIKIAKREKIPVIEDCALSLGGNYRGKALGTFGDISFFSTGRDKVLSSVFGGMILCKDKRLYKKLLEERDNLDYPEPRWVMQQLLHPVLFSLILPVYNLGLGKLSLGKVILFLYQKLGVLSRAVYWQEEMCQRPNIFPTKLPGALSLLAINQLKKLKRFNQHRKKIAEIYFREIKNTKYKLPSKNIGAIWVRFPVIVENAIEILECAKKKGVLLGDWYKEVVVPVRSLSLVGYEVGSCPNAESLAGKILNLPTYPSLTKKDASGVVKLIKQCSNIK